MLFSEVYGTYFDVLSEILEKAVDGELTIDTMYAIIQEKGFEESILTIPQNLNDQIWPLLNSDLITPLEHKPTQPITTLQKRWLKALLSDPRIKLFDPPTEGLEDVEPLFSAETVVYYDRYADGDDYRDPGYIFHFRTILRALRENRDLSVCFESRMHARLRLVVTPSCLEYSEKDDRFRLIASGRRRRWTINLSSITQCELRNQNEAGETADLEASDKNTQKDPPKASVTFELHDRRNALERVLLHFSHLEKETKRLDENRYLVTLKYDRQDQTEMVIRILSFGPVIRVTEPESFIILLRDRIERQGLLFK